MLHWQGKVLWDACRRLIQSGRRSTASWSRVPFVLCLIVTSAVPILSIGIYFGDELFPSPLFDICPDLPHDGQRNDGCLSHLCPYPLLYFPCAHSQMSTDRYSSPSSPVDGSYLRSPLHYIWLPSTMSSCTYSKYFWFLGTHRRVFFRI